MNGGLTNSTTLPSAGLLVLRVVVGVTFLVHGLDKLVDLPQRFLQRVRGLMAAPRTGTG
jgi:uncharacterized membrane protein YphA (DoxX/SURF4 family)